MDERWVKAVLSEINVWCERLAKFNDIDAGICDAAMERLTNIYEGLRRLHLRVVWNGANAVALRRAVDIVVDNASVERSVNMMKIIHDYDMARLRYEYEKSNN